MKQKKGKIQNQNDFSTWNEATLAPYFYTTRVFLTESRML